MNWLRSLWQSPRRLLLLSVVAVLMVQAVLFVRSAGTRGFASSDAGVKLWQVQSVVHTHRFDAPIEYPGAVYDPERQYSPFVPPWFFWQDNLPYSEYISPFIWVSAPLYAWFGHVGLLLMPWLAGALLVIISAWLAWRMRPDRSAALVPIIVGFSSPLLIYSLEFWEHTPGACLAAFALVGIVKAIDSPRRAWWLIASGLAIGLGLAMRAELYVYPIAIAIGLVLLRSVLPLMRSFILLAIGGLLTAGPWWLYQAIRWGSPFGPRVAQNVPLLGGNEMLTRLGDTTARNWTMLFPSAGSGLDVLIVLGVAALLLGLSNVLVRRSPLKSLLFSAQMMVLMALAGVTVWRLANWQTETGQRPDDLLTTFPLILLLLLPNLSWRTENRKSEIKDQRSEITRFLLAVSLSFLLLVLLVSPFQGGVQWGPRFLLPVMVPSAAVIVVHAMRLWRSAKRRRTGIALIFGMLLLIGFYSTWNGVRFIQDGQAGNVSLQNLIASLPERIVVTDAWFIPQGAPYTFGDKIWLMAEDEQSMFKLLQYLRKQTNEPGIIYISSLTWAHIDPQVLMGPRIAQNGDFQYFDWPGMYLQIARYFLYK